MRDRMRLLTFLAGCVLALLYSPEARCQTGAVALVEELRGYVLLRSGTAESVRLKTRLDFARRLYPDDVLSCGRGARLSIRIGGEVKPIKCPGSFTVQRPPALPDRLQSALDAYGRIGGRHRHSTNFRPMLVSPPRPYNVRPDGFVIRWRPTKRRCRADLSVETPDGEVLWRKEGVDARAGSTAPSAARQALRDYRAKNGAATLLLKLNDSCDNLDESAFSLLTTERERALTEELAAWDKEAARVLAHLGRSSVYLNYEMFTEAAEEYEAALALAPLSRELLDAAIDAQRRAGNDDRADALSRRLRD